MHKEIFDLTTKVARHATSMEDQVNKHQRHIKDLSSTLEDHTAYTTKQFWYTQQQLNNISESGKGKKRGGSRLRSAAKALIKHKKGKSASDVTAGASAGTKSPNKGSSTAEGGATSDERTQRRPKSAVEAPAGTKQKEQRSVSQRELLKKVGAQRKPRSSSAAAMEDDTGGGTTDADTDGEGGSAVGEESSDALPPSLASIRAASDRALLKSGQPDSSPVRYPGGCYRRRAACLAAYVCVWGYHF